MDKKELMKRAEKVWRKIVQEECFEYSMIKEEEYDVIQILLGGAIEDAYKKGKKDIIRKITLFLEVE